MGGVRLNISKKCSVKVCRGGYILQPPRSDNRVEPPPTLSQRNIFLMHNKEDIAER